MNDGTISALKRAGYRFYHIADEGLIETDKLRLHTRDRFVFLNYLLTVMPRAEIQAIFDRIRDKVRGLDLAKTSKFVSPELLNTMRTRADLVDRETARTKGSPI